MLNTFEARLKTPEFGPCACSQIRRTARKVSLFYDSSLLPSGLTVTQYAMLANIAKAGELSRTALAIKLGMDRTPLTRNLNGLVTGKLVAVSKGQDRRESLVRLTSAGRRKLQGALPLWEEAQRTFIAQMGLDSLYQLRALLTSAESAAARASGSEQNDSQSTRKSV